MTNDSRGHSDAGEQSCLERVAACLEAAGAIRVTGSSLRGDNNVRLDARGPNEKVLRFKLDVAHASYRHANTQQMSPVCDFGVLHEENCVVRLTVVEMKSGAADLAAVDQLQGGVDAVRKCVPDDCILELQHAVLVVGSNVARLKQLLTSKKASVKVGSQSRAIRVMNPGSRFDALPPTVDPPTVTSPRASRSGPRAARRR